MGIIAFAIISLLTLLAIIWAIDFVAVVFGSADEDAIDDYGSRGGGDRLGHGRHCVLGRLRACLDGDRMTALTRHSCASRIICGDARAVWQELAGRASESLVIIDPPWDAGLFDMATDVALEWIK